MKTTTLIISIFFFVFIDSFAQNPWIRLSGNPTENQLNEIIRIPGSSRLITVGDGSTILISDDLGESWQTILNPAGKYNEYQCMGVAFLSDSDGFIYGDNESILKTIDGGFHWEEKFVGEPNNIHKYINDLVFIDDQTGFAVADDGKLFRTTNGGDNWEFVETNTDVDLKLIEFINNEKGFILSSVSTSLMTTNGGLDWEVFSWESSLPDSYIVDLEFINDSTGLIALSQNETQIFRTTDEGSTWNEVYWNWKPTEPGKIEFINDLHGYFTLPSIFEYETSIIHTEDGGLSWTEYQPENLFWFDGYDLCIYNDETFFLAGYYGSIHKSIDGGLSWENKQQRIYNGDIYDFDVVNDEVAYFIHDIRGGGVLSYYLSKTDNGGDSWQMMKTNMIKPSCHFFNADTGYLASWDMDFVFEKTYDGGNNWTEIFTGIDMKPEAIGFYDLNNGLVAGDGDLYKTQDGGESWVETFSFNNQAKEIYYKNSNEVFFIGFFNELYKSIDGGANWEEIIIDGYNGAHDLFFLNEEVGFLGGWNSIFKTTDGGNTWVQSNIETENIFTCESIYFPSENIGYASGNGEFDNMLKTLDGGDNWFPIETYSTSNLKHLHFFDNEKGWVFGENGLYMSTSTGGVVSIKDLDKKDHSNQFSLHPNPTSEFFTIQLIPENHIENASLQIINFYGQIVKSYLYYDSLSNIQISTSDLIKGVYFVQIISGNQILSSQKLIIN